MTERMGDYNSLSELNRVAIVERIGEFTDDVRLVDWIDLSDTQVLLKVNEYADRLRISRQDFFDICVRGYKEGEDE